ncbi:LCP family protein [Cytobacillus sp. S13-E01]|uniref:LCP family glycopolymer transferase n=1 Tax=Cytobacillus sp. S13-E01 TaxID=3031326 RepID=UPI0023D8A396|nr:LCP family protein [Cytobacillus sp. S13-E01]MDF0726008.1 LCP family protein [Cytobacillus sp. S13-E01]
MKKKILLISASMLIALILFVVGLSMYLYFSVSNTVDVVMHEEVDRTNEKRPIDMKKKDPLAFLILGTDERGNERGRTDTIIIVTVNPTNNSMKMVSIPRDTRTMIVGRGNQDKINHAHAFGGVPMTIATVEQFLDIPIDYYIKVNMEGFKDIVDAVGGVTVNNRFEFTQSNITFPDGVQRLNGKEALAYVRMRKKDPRGDIGRNDRQREVIKAIIKEGAKISSITKINTILNAIGQNIRTDISFDEMKNLQANYSGVDDNTESIEINGTGTTINGVWYLQVPEEERLRISNKLKDQLNL